MDFKSQTPNSEFLTEDQEKLFWAQRTIEKFKEYDKKTHRLCAPIGA